MTFVVGVDGGGTRTRAVVIDMDGTELARVEGPGAVVTRERPYDAVMAVSTVVHAAVREADRDLPAAALWAGLAGAGQDAARTAVLGALVESGLASVVQVGTDVEAAFEDAFGSGPGILLIAGTGSIAWARRGDGLRVRVGGWGRNLGDEGSGYWIGQEALRAVLRAEDGRAPETALTGRVAAHCGLDDVRGLIGWTESATKAEIAGLAPVVGEAAEDGDHAARTILDEAVDELDRHLTAALERLGDPDQPPPLALWGGVVAPGGPLHRLAREALGRRPVEIVETEIDPPAGAARLARALA